MKARLHHRVNLLRAAAAAQDAAERAARIEQRAHGVAAIELGAVVALLLAALAMQLASRTPPSALGYLQHAGLLLIAVALLLALRAGSRAAHRGLALLGAVLTAAVALRQIAVRTASGRGAAGGLWLDPSLAGWALVTAGVVFVLAAAALALGHRRPAPAPAAFSVRTAAFVLFVLVAILAAANLASVALECGLSRCPSHLTRGIPPRR